jgi:xanthine dehydrogenase YagR molybdenum-binding subunit
LAPQPPASTDAPRLPALPNTPANSTCPGLAYGSVVTSTIPKGKIARIDTRAALGVGGVIDVITHKNRPKMAATDAAYHDDVAPAGSPFRPLYDNKIKFNAQPIALVVAEDWEIARFAGSLVTRRKNS